MAADLFHTLLHQSREQLSQRRESSGDMPSPSGEYVIRCILPVKACGCLIGPGGATLREISSTTDTTLRLQRKEELKEGASERLLTVSGTVSSLQRALQQARQLHS